MNNISKNDVVPFSTDLHLFNNAKLVSIGRNKSNNLVKVRKGMDIIEDNDSYMHFNLNLFDYLCLGKCKQQNKNYLLFRKGTLIYKEKLDVINIFNSVLFSEKKTKEEIIKNEIG